MDLEALNSANFTKLGDAVTDWSEMIDKLKKLEERANKQLAGRAQKANWSGVNATVTREFIIKTSKEFGDAVAQATSIRNILRDVRNELVTYRDQLRETIHLAREDRINVVDLGDGSFRVTDVSTATSTPAREGKLKAIRDEIQRILDKATHSDQTASEALQALANQAKYGFANASYKDRDAAAHALKAAEKAAKIAQDPENVSVKEFDALVHLLKKYSDDGLFAERFATELGAKGTAEFWAKFGDIASNPDLRVARGGHFDDLQKHLGLTLAEATQSDSPAMQRWERNMVNLGSDRFPTTHGVPRGFQVMSNLMRYGDYDNQFLTKYGEELIKYEKALTGNGTAATVWDTPAATPTLNYIGSDKGIDPMTGFMEALGKSPDASTEFFTSEGNFDYVAGEREWADEGKADHKALAHALTSAATGQPYSAEFPKGLPSHTWDQTQVMEMIVHGVATQGGFDLKPGMHESIARATAEYTPDMFYAIREDKSAEGLKLFPVPGERADFTHRGILSLLAELGQHPDAYAGLMEAQKLYTANVTEYHLRGDLPEDKQYPPDVEETVQAIFRTSGEVSGSLAIGRQEAVIGKELQEMKAFDESVSRGASWGLGATTLATGLGTVFISNPVGAAIAGGTLGAVAIGGFYEFDNAMSHSDEVIRGSEKERYWEIARESDIAFNQEVLRRLEEEYDIEGENNFSSWALEASKQGFNYASGNMIREAPSRSSADQVPSAYDGDPE